MSAELVNAVTLEARIFALYAHSSATLKYVEVR
jgi:hypothetical protein